MKKSFLHGTYPALRIAMLGFTVTLVAVMGGFISFYFDKILFAKFFFTVTVLGVVIGFIGIIYGWFKHGKEAVLGGVKSMQDLTSKFTGK